MSSFMKRRWLPLVAVAGLIVSSAWAQDQGRTFQWKGKLAPDQVIEIQNISGAIDAESAGGDQVEVTAEKSGPRAEEVKIAVVPSSEGVTICAVYPGMDTDCRPGHSHSSNVHTDQTKVDFHVLVPRNVRFSAENVNGRVTAEHMGRSVRASSVNGSVKVSTQSWAEVSSVNGSVECSMGSADWTGTLKISTVNGSIRLEVPSDLSADVSFRSVNGRLNTDFPLTVSGSFGGRRVHGTIGKGGRELVVETVNGNVELKKSEI